MAVDQALLEFCESHSQPILRFYQWNPATLSLGYFQKSADRGLHRASRELDCVRRSTGGGAIVHDRELTYSLCLPSHDRWDQEHRKVYTDVHLAILDTLAKFGVSAGMHGTHAPAAKMPVGCGAGTESNLPFLCFLRRTDGDIVLDGHKVCGSAQRRGRQAILQHGSILLEQSSAAPELPGILELTGQHLFPEDFANSLLNLILGRLNLSPVDVNLSESLAKRAEEVRRLTFSADSWTNNR